jgi:hypothetical protein
MAATYQRLEACELAVLEQPQQFAVFVERCRGLDVDRGTEIGTQRRDTSRNQLVGFQEIVIAAVSKEGVVQRAIRPAIGDVVLGLQCLLHLCNR